MSNLSGVPSVIRSLSPHCRERERGTAISRVRRKVHYTYRREERARERGRRDTIIRKSERSSCSTIYV